MNVALAQKIQTLLINEVAVTGICAERSYFGQAPQPVTSPYNVLLEVATTGSETHDDFQGMDAVLIQFNCYAKTPALALQLRSAIRAALAVAGALVGAVVTQPSQRLFKEELVELWNAQLDFLIYHAPIEP